MSAIIVTLREDDATARRAIEADARFALGAAEGLRLPLALDTPDCPSDEAAVDWLRALPGVALVDVVAVFLDPPELP